MKKIKVTLIECQPIMAESQSNMAESIEHFNGHVLIYGGNGALGSGCVSKFKTQNWWVGSVEQWKKSTRKEPDEADYESSIHVLLECKNLQNQNPNKEADVNILVHSNKSLKQQETDILYCLDNLLHGTRLDAIICVAGGFITGNINGDFMEDCEKMWQQNVWPSVLSASIAARHLKLGGMLCLTGAKTALDGTPNNIAYGMCKSTIHQLTRSLAKSGSGLPRDSLVIALLPITLDTVMNRQTMPAADISAWTPTKYITDLMYKWSTGEERPTNGSLIQFVTQNFNTHVTFL